MAASSSPPDMSLINELFEAIERNPAAVEARKLLVQTLVSAGWLDAARDGVQELLQLDPNDPDVQTWSNTLGKQPPDSTPSAPVTAEPSAPEMIELAQQGPPSEHGKLRARVRLVLQDIPLLRDLVKAKAPPNLEKVPPDAGLVATGRSSTSPRTRQPRNNSARSVARAMERDPDKAVDTAVADFAEIARWLRSSASQSAPLDNDAIRDALVKRVHLLAAPLPRELKPYAFTALMHAEHEFLQRTYVNNETMLGDPVADIPRDHFWVSEDGYAWDMEELAQAITSNSGVFRNPLSRILFTPSDVRAILDHPLGRGLSALRTEQGKLSKGVRPETIEQLERVSTVLLEDMSNDQVPSRHAVDEFLVYTAMLPEAEQRAIDKLRVSAKDSHTGQPFDVTIGEAVRDAQGNRVCFHKTGDFLRQAAAHLRQTMKDKNRESFSSPSSCRPQ